MKRRPASRPRRIACPDCGLPMVLVDCGVTEHRKTRTRREQLDGRCPGRVYAHITIDAMDRCTGPGMLG